MTSSHTLFSRVSSIALFAIALLSISSSLALASGSHSDEHSEKHGAKMSIGEPGIASEVSRTIEIIMQDNLFEPESISVNEGETIKFIIKNEGEFVHEFNIGTAAMHAGHQEEMMMMMEHGALEADKINHHMMKMDMGGGKTMEHNDPNSVLLEPSKSAEIIWKFSNKTELEFACNVPGHYESGMMGQVKFK
jgi:uncharacterized cupredoxin-like copper-binding protein